ncbi:MAG: OmpA family protein [Pseudomonadaceae bacterium]|nr:OmpA family protein [Pseudomonadaceae bacterium]
MRLPALLCLLLLPTLLHAAADIPGAKDHELLERYPASHISEYQRNYNAVDFAIGSQDGVPQRRSLEGNATQILYFHDKAETQPSPLQLIRNYQNAIKAIGGEVVYERLPAEGDGGETTLKVLTGGKEFWVRVEPGIYSVPTQSYRLAIVEIAVMQQLVSANQLLDELERNGFVALYINFDSGKAELKDDGQAAVREIVAMLQAAPQLRIAIEGHTDNVGQAADNKALSERRAQAVLDALLAAGIEAGRLSAAGFGQERPVADNRSEEGRAKNRRVELVKQ